jgi:hypothetical protein
MMGNVACAEGAIAGGCEFAAGYPITPASEIGHTLAKRLPEVDGYFLQTEDEISAICSAGVDLRRLTELPFSENPTWIIRKGVPAGLQGSRNRQSHPSMKYSPGEVLKLDLHRAVRKS